MTSVTLQAWQNSQRNCDWRDESSDNCRKQAVTADVTLNLLPPATSCAILD